jgi:hypothetical protein
LVTTRAADGTSVVHADVSHPCCHQLSNGSMYVLSSIDGDDPNAQGDAPSQRLMNVSQRCVVAATAGDLIVCPRV